MKAVISCDEVFDALTRGPFPSGHADDDFIDAHLSVCHECRQLAEALRPAVNLFHESMPDKDEASLPFYRVGLAEALQTVPALSNVVSVDLKHTAKQPVHVTASTFAVAMTGLLAILLLLTNTLVDRTPGTPSQQTAKAASPATNSDNPLRPALASLGIPLSCLPNRVEPLDLNRVRSANLALTPSQREDFACCTRCHYSGGKPLQSRPAIQKVMVACAHCHQVTTSDQNA